MSEGFFSRGFRGHRQKDELSRRLPPGQYLERGFPVLSTGPTPHTRLANWDFSIVGEVDQPKRWSWDEFHALPREAITKDIHCETKWSKLDTHWEGVSLDALSRGRDLPDELDHLMKSSSLLEVVQTLTRVQPPGWTGYGCHIDQRPLAYICGPTPFVETAAASLVELGHEPARIKTERFGPTGET